MALELDDRGYDQSGHWYSPGARLAMGLPGADGMSILGGFLVRATRPARTTDTIRNGFLVKRDGTPMGGPVMIRGGRPVVVRPNEPAYLRGQAIADTALAGDARTDAANAANRAFWAKGRRA